MNTIPWRGSLLPLGCAAAPKPSTAFFLSDRNRLVGAALRPSGSKLPGHEGVQCWAVGEVGSAVRQLVSEAVPAAKVNGS
ncbi:hypothetical protein C1886_22990 [Pseudomonas sp. FW300-N1A1]|nr:hypothetical protein C1886_22990 [Pseudomonas sp. FW300-N1A1]